MALATVSHRSHHEVPGHLHLPRSPAAAVLSAVVSKVMGSGAGSWHLSFFRCFRAIGLIRD